MKAEELKELILKSLSENDPDTDVLKQLNEAGVSYSFSDNFTERVIKRIFSTETTVNREIEFLRTFNRVFYRIAVTGIAAITLLLISIYISQGNLSVDSFFGLSDGTEESIVCILTGN
ncbi:MAG: hypothetical protein ACUVTX_00185 [Bacteroidales bacterium]